MRKYRSRRFKFDMLALRVQALHNIPPELPVTRAEFRNRLAATFVPFVGLSLGKDHPSSSRRQSQKNYHAALSKGACFFFIFLLSTSLRSARERTCFDGLPPDVANFQLEPGLLSRIHEWAILDRYVGYESFYKWMKDLRNNQSLPSTLDCQATGQWQIESRCTPQVVSEEKVILVDEALSKDISLYSQPYIRTIQNLTGSEVLSFLSKHIAPDYNLELILPDKEEKYSRIEIKGVGSADSQMKILFNASMGFNFVKHALDKVEGNPIIKFVTSTTTE